MELVSQGFFECVLAAGAMVKGKTMQEVRELASCICNPWNKHTHKHEREFFDLLGISPFYVSLKPQDLETRSHSFLQGKGIIRIASRHKNGNLLGHMVAYENEVIYDSQKDAPYSFSAWESSWKGGDIIWYDIFPQTNTIWVLSTLSALCGKPKQIG